MKSNLQDGETNCLLVHPKCPRYGFWNYIDVCKIAGAKYPEPPLGLLTVAALLPRHWKIKLVDENVAALTDDDLAAAWSKLEAYAARFALIFQLCTWAAGDAAVGHCIDE